MSNGFGFTTPGTRPAPDPRAVGAMLMQGPQMGGMGMGQAPQGAAPMAPQQAQKPRPPLDDHTHREFPARSQDEAMRREGGKLMGSGGPDEDGALAAAVGEALTRKGGGHKGNQNPYKNRERHIQQLQQLGISEVEAMLLGETL